MQDDMLLDEVTDTMAKNRTIKKKVSSSNDTSDQGLLSVMMARLTHLEQRLGNATRELHEKDKKIAILEDKLRILKRSKDNDYPSRNEELERKCLMLQQELHEIENFLADYGMVWVGSGSKPDSQHYLSDDDDDEDDPGQVKTWNPGSSLAGTGKTAVNFDLIIDNIKELNILANEGVAKVQHTVDGARLKIPEPVPLTLYLNGIVMFSGPFRSYEEPETQRCIQDLQDGYFPSELQLRYPDGIPIAVTDRRGVYFKEKQYSEAFQGDGHVLGGHSEGQDNRSRLVPVSARAKNRAQHTGDKVESNHRTGPQLTVEQFLNQLPKSVVKNGKIIDIRNNLGDLLQGSPGNVGVTVVDTPHMKTEGPGSSHDVTTLRVKTESGDHTYVIKLKYSQTIGDLINYIDKERSSKGTKSSGPYEIISTFPKKTYSDYSQSLQSCGLVPSATLHLISTKR